MSQIIDNVHNAESSIQTVWAVYQSLKNDRTNINPKYQRKIVWSLSKKKAFICSIMRNIVPNNIIFNIDDDNGNSTCIDGKQRLTSIMEFIENKFSIGIPPLYYSESDNGNIFTPRQKSMFDRRKLSIVQYTNLSYHDQVDIFNRLQNGMSLSSGEILPSLLQTEEIANQFIDFCDNNYQLCKKYIHGSDNRRYHIVFLTKLLYMVANKTMNYPSKPEYTTYLHTTPPNILLSHMATLQKILTGLLGNKKYFNNPVVVSVNGFVFSVMISGIYKYKSNSKIKRLFAGRKIFKMITYISSAYQKMNNTIKNNTILINEINGML